MIYLLFSIISSTAIFVIFKQLDRIKTETFPVIVINYIVASSLGYLLNGHNSQILTVYNNPWFIYAVIIGIAFIIMFYIISLSSQKIGIAVTSVASKMSVIIPITFSILYDPEDNINLLKSAGILTALLAVFLTVYKKGEKKIEKKYIYLPIIMFIGMGIVDSIVRFSQFKYINNEVLPFFSATLFSIAGISGILFSLIKRYSIKRFLNIRVIFFGALLGIVNFGTIYFIIKALNHKNLVGSVVFGINNIGVVGLSVILALLLFREKLSRINWIGISLSIIAIIILSFSQNI